MISAKDLTFRDEIVYRLLPRLITRFPIDKPEESLNKAYRLADAFIERIKKEHNKKSSLDLIDGPEAICPVCNHGHVTYYRSGDQGCDFCTILRIKKCNCGLKECVICTPSIQGM